MLVAKNISFTAGKKFLLQEVSASFEPGKLNLVIGPNGAGKSTFIKLLSSHHHETKGDVLYGEKHIRDLSVHHLARIRAVLSQNIDLAFPLEVEEVVMMGRYPHFSGQPSEADQQAVQEAVHLFELEPLLGRNYMTLSGGEKQRVHFARVLAQIWYPAKNDCRYLFLDEPLTYLDIFFQYQFLRKIKSLLSRGDMIVVGVLHDLNLAASFADHIVLLHHGKVLCAGEKESVLTKESIRTAYKMDALIRNEDNELRIFF